MIVLCIFVHIFKMKRAKNILFISLTSILSSCLSSVTITSVVEKSKQGDFLVKWEVSPDVEGNIDIYTSLSDSDVDKFMPVRTKNINDQFAVINPTGSGLREYFLLKTEGVTSGIIANRVIDMDNVQNFRDLGGYFTSDKKQIKWGKIYRSAQLGSANLFDQERIKRLKIKTIIDFRTKQDVGMHPILISDVQIIRIPIVPGDMKKIEQKINNNDISRSDAIVFMQNAYREMIESSADKYAEMFNILIDQNNYPLLISSSLGKDRVGMASYFLLRVLDIPVFVAEEDYLLSNRYLDPQKSIEYAGSLSESIQEAVTALLSADLSYLNYATDYIVREYGSMDNYMEKKLRVTSGKKAILKKILLYNP